MKHILSSLLGLCLLATQAVFAQGLLTVNTTQLQFPATTEQGLDSLSLTVTNTLPHAVDCRVLTFAIYDHKPFWTPDSIFVLGSGAQRAVKVYFKPLHNILNNSELIIQNNSGLGALRVDLLGQGVYANSYYASTQNTEGENLRAALNTRTGSPYTVLGYSGANNARLRMFGIIDNWKTNGREPGHANPYKNECVYTGRTISYTGASFNTGTLNNAPFTMNTEHTWPQSFGASNDPMQSDLHHLYPSDGPTNSARGNKPFGWVANPTLTYTGGSKANSTTFEPRDEHKAAVSRSMLYFAVRYMNTAGVSTSYLTQGMEEDLRAWVKLFPADSVLIKRNNDIAFYQQNRNPFIDYPQFLDRMDRVRAAANIPVVQSFFMPDTSVYLGDPAPMQQVQYRWVVVNTGTQPLQLSGIQLVGTGLSYNGPSNLSIARGEAGLINFTYVSDGNARTGQLNFGTNVPGQTAVSIPVVVGSTASSLSAFSLLSPFNGLTYTIEGDSNVLINFRWQPSVPNVPGQAVTYAMEITSGSPATVLLSRSGLTADEVGVSVGSVSRALDSLGLAPNAVLACQWQVTATAAGLSRVSNEQYAISFRRGLMSSVAEAQLAVRVYPNPAGDFLKVEGEQLDANSRWSVRDAAGRAVAVTGQLEEGGLQLNLSGLAAGMYFVEVEGRFGSSRLRFVKQP